MKTFQLLVVAVLMGACAAQKYLAPNFDQVTANHQTVAVLPVEMVFTGRQPKDLTPEDITEIEEAESNAFQISLHNALLSKADKMRVYFQEVDKTNNLLDGEGISIRDGWKINGEELAQLLGVDAVVKMRVEKQRYLSDLESFGIDLAQHLIHVLSDYTIYPWLPGQLEKTNDIRARATLVNGKDGMVLWNLAVTRQTDWHRPANEIINDLTRKMARNFPYTE